MAKTYFVTKRKMGGEGPVRKIEKVAERVGIKDYPIPPCEPENAHWRAYPPYQKIDPATGQPLKDKKGGIINFHRIEKDLNNDGIIDQGTEVWELSEYDFWLKFYEAQVAVLNEKIKAVENKIKTYQVEIVKIDKYVEKQEEGYRRQELRVLQAQAVRDTSVDEYKRDRGSMYEEGDLEEIGQARAIEVAKKSVPQLEAKSTIYRTTFWDLDDPVCNSNNPTLAPIDDPVFDPSIHVVQKVFEDITLLKDQYEDNIDKLEDEELPPLKYSKDANEFHYKKAVEARNQYYAYLNTP